MCVLIFINVLLKRWFEVYHILQLGRIVTIGIRTHIEDHKYHPYTTFDLYQWNIGITFKDLIIYPL